LKGKAETKKAAFLVPMKALGSTVLPTGIWSCEIKFDGYRAVAVINDGQVELWSRTRKSMTGAFPQVAADLEGLKCRSAVIDGEIVALDSDGKSRFQLLQNRGETGESPKIVYFAFDLMHHDGKLLTGRSLEDRAAVLGKLVGRGGRHLQLSRTFLTEPSSLFAEAKKNGLEGIIAKRPESLYEPDRRSGAWLKCKVLAEQEFVVGGFTEPQNSRHNFGAVLVGYFEEGRLQYAGKVGTGFSEKALGQLHRTFLAKAADKCPFANLPSPRKSRFGAGMGLSEMRKVTWLRPALVAQVRFAEWTEDGLLRQPVFLGLRTDKPAKEVVREPGMVRKKGGTKSAR
jgi:bifunctional non-homologous end joining protein LigD